MNHWIMVINKYDGIYRKAINMFSGFFSSHIDYVLPVKFIDDIKEDELKENDIIVIGEAAFNRVLQQCEKAGLINTPVAREGYSIYVGENLFNPTNQMIAISGGDQYGVLYGCADFCNKCYRNVLYKPSTQVGPDYMWGEHYFENPFNRKLKNWKHSSVPAIKERALWTWGHVIYDYRKYLDNMAKIKLNEIVIWNDRVPLNADEVVEYAHSLGIKVIWGFAWGWEPSDISERFLQTLDEETLQKLKASILETYANEYSNAKGDGIYFQSFTELTTDRIGGKCIAELVTDLVNEVSGILLEHNPELHIQFGLHATSVSTHLDIISRVDNRVHIVWEDCGAFPYSYLTSRIEDFSETVELTKKLLNLRGDKEKFGAVLKGMINLDWSNFNHFSDNYILGEKTADYIESRSKEKDRIWKIVQAGWIKNADYARRMIEIIAQKDDAIVQALVEDAAFENRISLPVALYSEMLWNTSVDTNELIEEVSNYPFVEFSNI